MFFATATVLVLVITGAQHKILRDGFDDYVASVKVQRLSTIENAVIAYDEQNPNGISGLAQGQEWAFLVIGAEAQRDHNRRENGEPDKIGRTPSGGPLFGPLPPSFDLPAFATAADGLGNYSRSRLIRNNYSTDYWTSRFKLNREPSDKVHLMPPILRGVALLDASGNFVIGESMAADNALRAPIVNESGRVVGQWLIRKGAPEMDGLGRRFLEGQLESMFFMLAIAAIFSAVCAWLLAQYFRKPVRRLKDAFRRVSAGQLDTRLPANGHDEVSEIEQHFNLMASNLGAQESARKQWMADTSHELRTPLTILRTRMEAMRDGIIPSSDAEWDRNLKVVTDFSHLVNDLQAMARTDAGHWDLQNAAVDVKTWLTNTYRDNKASFDAAGLNLELKLDDQPMTVWGDESRLQQVLRNLLVNSMRYTDVPGTVNLIAEKHDKTVRVIVEDSSPGVSDQSLARLFERFYREDGSRNRATGGSGLGLAICDGIVKVHRGTIHAEHSAIGGLRVIIDLPLWQTGKAVKPVVKK